MGMVVFLLLGLSMVLAPRIKRREPKYPAPPGGPEPLRSPLLAPRHPTASESASAKSAALAQPLALVVTAMSLLLALVSFAGCAAGGLWLIGVLRDRAPERAPVPARLPDDPWIAPPEEGSIAGTHVWAGRTRDGVLRSPADCAAIIVGPPRSGKTRKVIAPTLACWDGPALVTSTKGDILATAAHRARYGPVAVYDPTGSLGHPEATVGFSPLTRCETWDGAVEVAAAMLSPAGEDETVRHGEHFAVAARALLAPLFHAAALSGGGMDSGAGVAGPLGVLRAGGDPARRGGADRVGGALRGRRAGRRGLPHLGAGDCAGRARVGVARGGQAERGPGGDTPDRSRGAARAAGHACM